jgi:IMP cyclohydrolase
MPHPLEALKKMEYPGRVIVLGRDPSDRFDVVVYAVTGRSPSSQARRLERRGNAIVTQPTDPEVLKTGNPDLLVYPAILWGSRISVSNGKQTEDIARNASGPLVASLETALAGWSYEPDAPIFTPRISGLIDPNGRAALSSIMRAPDGSSRRHYYEWSPRPGTAEMSSTYSGPNQNPLPVFSGDPLPLELAEPTAEATAAGFYEALGPVGRAGDFRVAVACVFFSRTDPSRPDISIINRHERTTR